MIRYRLLLFYYAEARTGERGITMAMARDQQSMMIIIIVYMVGITKIIHTT